MKNLELSFEEISALESLDILGGAEGGSGAQYDCVNTATGCGLGSTQYHCTNSVANCECQIPITQTC